jgi:hypothetical protein
MPDPNAPKGYSLVPRDESVPSFIREAVGPVKETTVSRLTNDPKGIETLASHVPGTISVYDRDKYTPQVRTHEMTHEFQGTRSSGTIPLPFGYEIRLGDTSSSAPMNSEKGNLANYEYGGQAGLQSLINAHKTAASLNPEQQADMVADYQARQQEYLAKVKAGKATPADLRKMYETYQAYHPFVQQMADAPKPMSQIGPAIKTLLMGKSLPPPNPVAPGLPSYDTPGLGVAPADPLLGGQSQSIPAAPKLGDQKRFVNGKIGVWDGHGWRAKRQ